MDVSEPTKPEKSPAVNRTIKHQHKSANDKLRYALHRQQTEGIFNVEDQTEEKAKLIKRFWSYIK